MIGVFFPEGVTAAVPSLVSSCKHSAIFAAARREQCRSGLGGFIETFVLFQSKAKLVQRQECHSV